MIKIYIPILNDYQHQLAHIFSGAKDEQEITKYEEKLTTLMIHKISKGVYFDMVGIENENKLYINDFEDFHLEVTN